MKGEQITEKQTKLLDFVKEQHAGQVRKYTGDPYHVHLESVAELVSVHAPDLPFGIEVALCHDLFEDTSCGKSTLLNFLMKRYYTIDEAKFIVDRVLELTDHYTTEAFPSLNRAARKQLEAHRLGETHYVSQTVKCLDRFDNLFSIVQHDPKFAKVYLEEAKNLHENLVKARHNALRLLECLLYDPNFVYEREIYLK